MYSVLGCLCALWRVSSLSDYTSKVPDRKVPESEDKASNFFLTILGLRIYDYKQQIAKMWQRGMHPELFESYLMAHKYGLPPHGGLGLGLERFTARLLDFGNMRRAALFPMDIHRVLP